MKQFLNFASCYMDNDKIHNVHSINDCWWNQKYVAHVTCTIIISHIQYSSFTMSYLQGNSSSRPNIYVAFMCCLFLKYTELESTDCASSFQPLRDSKMIITLREKKWHRTYPRKADDILTASLQEPQGGISKIYFPHETTFFRHLRSKAFYTQAYGHTYRQTDLVI